jgi:predicted dehydrogenase
LQPKEYNSPSHDTSNAPNHALQRTAPGVTANAPTTFARAVSEGAPVKATARDGLTALKVSLAALESISTGKTVEIS